MFYKDIERKLDNRSYGIDIVIEECEEFKKDCYEMFTKDFFHCSQGVFNVIWDEAKSGGPYTLTKLCNLGNFLLDVKTAWGVE